MYTVSFLYVFCTRWFLYIMFVFSLLLPSLNGSSKAFIGNNGRNFLCLLLSVFRCLAFQRRCVLSKCHIICKDIWTVFNIILFFVGAITTKHVFQACQSRLFYLLCHCCKFLNFTDTTVVFFQVLIDSDVLVGYVYRLSNSNISLSIHKFYLCTYDNIGFVLMFISKKYLFGTILASIARSPFFTSHSKFLFLLPLKLNILRCKIYIIKIPYLLYKTNFKIC